MKRKPMITLTPTSLARLENFGHSLSADSHLFQPTHGEQVLELFRAARREGFTITLRGAGRSYNDAALNGGGAVLDFQGMNKILDWDPATGRITAEPGVTLRQLWQVVLPDGWWPPVVSGTMTTTLGGCLGANIHGKNNFKMGTIGEHVTEFTAILPTGAEITCSPEKNADLFYSFIGGFGLLGVFKSVTMQMKKMHSGLLRVFAYPAQTLHEQLHFLEEGAPKHDYIVGWLDALATGNSLGRGQIHAANYLHEGEDPNPRATMQVAYQSLPSTLFGVFPKSLLHYFMTPFMINPGVWMVNTAKYVASLRTHDFLQPHAAFHFLLDYVPNWERAYGSGGIVQYQSFLPRESALAAWTSLLTLSNKRGMPSYLGVTKRHQPDKFLLTHAVDGFSLAMDFKVTAGSRARMRAMFAEFDEIVLAHGGRFYFAKNGETSAEAARRFLGEETINRFRTLKQRTDPDHILQSDLYRRIFG
jgi:decaprenylphospho-beta-D-ribofuranose 2-oxidase